MFWDFLKIIAYFCVCVFVIWLSYRVSKAMGGRSMGFGTSKYMKVVDRAALGKDTSISIVRVGERYLLVGAGSGKVSLICELTREDLTETQDIPGSDIYSVFKDGVSPVFDKINEFRAKKSGKKKKNFSQILGDNMDDYSDEIDLYEDYDDETESSIDELLKKSRERADEYKDKMSDK